MWYITQTSSSRGVAINVSLREYPGDVVAETITLQICGLVKPVDPLTLSSQEWDEIVALVEADRSRRAQRSAYHTKGLKE